MDLIENRELNVTSASLRLEALVENGKRLDEQQKKLIATIRAIMYLTTDSSVAKMDPAERARRKELLDKIAQLPESNNRLFDRDALIAEKREELSREGISSRGKRECQETIASCLEGNLYNMSTFACADMLAQGAVIPRSRLRYIEYPKTQVVSKAQQESSRETQYPEKLRKLKRSIGREFERNFGFKPAI